MSKARQQANLSSDGNLFADISNDRVGIGSVVPTHKLHVAGTSKFDDDVKFEGTTAALNVDWDKSDNELNFSDSTKLTFGDGTNGDFRLYHDNNSWIKNNSGNLTLNSNIIHLKSANNSKSYLRTYTNDRVEIYFNNGEKFRTTSTGAKVTGNLEVTGVLTYDDVTSIDSVGIITARDHIHINADNKQLKIGAHADGDLLAYHDGTKSVIVNYTGDFHLRSNNGSRSSNEGIILKPNGSTELYHSGNKKFETTSSGVTVNGNVYVAGSQNAQLTTNQLIFDRAGYSYIDQINNAGSLVFRVTSSNTIGLRIDSNAQAIFGSSLIIPDAIQHEGDLDCKIRFPGTDTITFETASNERLRIHADGEVECKGGAAGQNALLVSGNYSGSGNVDIQTWQRIGGAVQAKMIYKDADTSMHFGTDTAHKLCLMTGGTERLRIDTNGMLHISDRNSANAGDHVFQAGSFGIRMADAGGYNRWNIERNYGGWQSVPLVHFSAQGRVGINQASPGSALNVKAIGSASDGLQVTSSSHSSYVWQIQNNDNLFNGSLAGELGIRGSSGISFSANAGTSTHLRITSAGKLGLGEASPDQILHIRHATHPYIRTTLNDATVAAGNVFGAWEFESLDISTNCAGVVGKIDCISNATFDGTSTNGADIRFLTSGTNPISLTERLRITSGGNVGINDSNPDNQLVVKSVSGHTTAKVTSGDETTSMVMQAIQGSEGRLGMNTNHPLAIYAGGLEKVRIDSSGKIGMGIDSPYLDKVCIKNNVSAGTDNWALHLLNGTHASDSRIGLAFQANNNAASNTWDGSGIYAANDGSTGACHTMFGTVINGSFTERVRITSSGHLKILGQGQTTGFYLTNSYGQAGLFGGMFFNGSSWVRDAHATRKGAGMYINTGGHVVFLKAPETSGTSATVTESARISASGYLGINTNNPQRYLHIVGNDGATGATLGNSDTQLVIDNTGGNGAIVEFLGSNNGAGRIMFTDTDGTNRGRMEYSHNGDYLRFDAAGNERLRVTNEYINVGNKNSTAYAVFRTHNNRGMEWNYNAIRSPQNHSSGISGWVFLGHDYGANPYPVRTFKIAVPESGVQGTRVYQVWHDGDANYDYGGMWEIRINQWTSSARFESVAIRCINGNRNDMCVRAYNNSNGIMIRPASIWGSVYLRLAGYDDNQGYRGSSYCAVANNGALAIYNAQGTDSGTVPTSGSPVDVFPFDGNGGSYTGGRDIENSNWFNA